MLNRAPEPSISRQRLNACIAFSLTIVGALGGGLMGYYLGFPTQDAETVNSATCGTLTGAVCGLVAAGVACKAIEYFAPEAVPVRFFAPRRIDVQPTPVEIAVVPAGPQQ